MNERARRLQPAVQVARTREDEAAHALAEFRQRLSEHEVRLRQLQAYRGEYTAQLQDAGHQGLSAHQLRNYANFITSIDQSIARSRQQLEQLRGEYQRQHTQWLSHRAKTQALETVVERYQREQGRVEDRREQAANDERALRGCWKAED